MHRYPHPNNATAGQRLYPPDLLLQRPERVATSSTSLCVEFKNNSTLQDIFNATLKDASGHPRYHITTRSSRTSLSTTATVELAHIDWGNLNMLHMLDTGKVVVLSDWLVASEDRRFVSGYPIDNITDQLVCTSSSRWTMTLGNTLYRWTRSNDHFSVRPNACRLWAILMMDELVE